MAAVTKETLKKHHFWILVGLTPILVLIAVILIDSTVGAEIETKAKKIADDEKKLNGKDAPKSEKLLSLFGAQLDELGRKRTDLWKENWERQIGLSVKKVNGKDAYVQDPVRNLLRWPKSARLDRFNYGADYATNKTQLKFGATIPNDSGEYNEFTKQEVYLAEFSNPFLKDPEREVEKRTGMADRVYPTAFAGGWQAVLRHVTTPAGWGEQVPKPEQLWLALEDIWIQRAVLDAVKQVNDSVARFHLVPRYDANGVKLDDSKLERSFSSRIWNVTLKVAQRPGDGRFVITGTLRNVTDRLQLLGNGNMLVLNLWLSNAPGAQPIPFRIGGEFIPGGEVRPIASAEEHLLPAGISVEEIARIEQVFDTKTVPIRRIDHLALGKRDSRHAAFVLKEPEFALFKKEAEAEKAKADAASSSSGPGNTPMGGGGGPPPMGSFGSGGNSGSNSAAVEGQLEGGGAIASVIDGNRKRYIEATQQIRRMPVAITVVVDQAYMNDVMMAYANLPMRFQITQFHWQRFRGSLGGGSTGSSGFSGGSDDVAGPARGTEGSGIKFGGSGGGPPPGMIGPMGPGGPKGPSMPPGTGPGFPGSGPSFPGSGGSAPPAGTFSEAQLTAGLVELTIYGIVSVYEKYETPDPATTTP